MSKSQNCNKSKKKSASKQLCDENCTKPASSLQDVNGINLNNIEVSGIENNAPANASSKKKKKKKKKSQQEGQKAETEVDSSNNKTPDISVPKGFEDLLKLSEISVTVTSQPPQVDVLKTEAQQPGIAENGSVEQTSTKKKKKKKKKKQKNSLSEGDNQEEKDEPPNPGPVIPPVQQPICSSYTKIPTQSGDSVLLVVSPFENAKNNGDAHEQLNKKSINNSVNSQALNNFVTISRQEQPFQPRLEQQVPLAQSSPLEQINLTSLVNTGKDCKNANEKQLCPETTGEACPQKTKAQLKAERRAIQEAQRAAKAANKLPTDSRESVDKTVSAPKPIILKPNSDLKSAKETRKINFFSHLPPFKSQLMLKKHLESDSFIHPAITSVSSLHAKDSMIDSNASCIEILAALKKVIGDYITPPNKEFRRDLGSKIETYVSFITKCRPLSVGTLFALKSLKQSICNVPVNLPDEKAKASVCEQIEKFVKDSISLAVAAISKEVSFEIRDGDVILTYAYSSVVVNALYEAHEQKKSFKVIIIDSRPEMEGRVMLKCLLKRGISCSYTWIHAITFVMKDVTKVIVGAHAVRASGYVMSRIGTSQIALLALSCNVPFIVCCEGYKFCDRALIDSFIDNELGDPESLAKTHDPKLSVLENWKEIGHLELLNPLFDVTPPHLISKLITEKSHSG